MTRSPHDMTELRARLSEGGPALWRSLEAVAETPAFTAFLSREFPAVARLAAGPDRRQVLRLMAASFAFAGLAACSEDDPRSKEVPYVRLPGGARPGAPSIYASATLLDGVATPVTVLTRDGRPLKIEGNASHPWTRGGTDVFAQAAILDLYDPTRSQSVRSLDRPSSWQTFQAAMLGRFSAFRAERGRGLRLLTGPIGSPSLLAQIEAFVRAFPETRWHTHHPAEGHGLAGVERAFGRELQARWRFERASVVVSIDGDFLDPGPHQIGTARDWIEARRASVSTGRLLTLHSAASTPSLTSAKSDFHLAVGPRTLADIVDRLRTAVAGAAPTGADPASVWVARASAALGAARGRGIVLAGEAQPAAVHEAVHRLNDALGNLGQTVFFTAPAVRSAESLGDLVGAMEAGEVSALVMLGSDPVYSAPGNLPFAAALAKVPLKIHAGIYLDQTAAHADWHLPLAHTLESWGDARAFDGTVSFIQPTIAPLYGGRSMGEILSMLSEAEPRGGLSLLRDYWRQGRDEAGFDAFWRRCLLDGFVAGTAFEPEAVTLLAERPPPPPAPPGGLDVVFRPDPTVWDGALANNGWLQELPKPLTKTVWENVVALSPVLAEREGLGNGDMVRISIGDDAIEGPVWILPGQSAETVTLTLGYGRSAPEMLDSGLGYSTQPLRHSGSPWARAGGRLTKLGSRVRLATTQDHATLEGHDFVRVSRGGATVETVPTDPPSFYGRKDDGGRAWGMVIDEDACIGCNACVIACQAENNIPVVGKDQVAAGREMHWLRIDRYYSGLKTGAGLDDPDTHFQPVPCMHCEEAPCEVGCPVEATLHDHEGLNLMVYNRCVGTRACSSYCPYKVRRFNYLDYTSGATPVAQLQRNPEVTVRARGVMEKCTYCVQRIAAARIVADETGEPIRDGAVETACQGACPTRAIVFGDLDDPSSAVRAARADPRNYALLGELNLKPRTTYLAERAPPAPAREG